MTNCKILFVDDDIIILNSVTRLMRKLSDIEIITSTSATQAFSILKNDTIDIVVSDFLMPEINGVDFLIHAKQEYPLLITLLLTGQATIPDVQKAINEAELFSFIVKPWNSDEFLEQIQKACQEAKRKKLQNLASQAFNEYQKSINIENEDIYVALAEWDEIYGPKPIGMYPEITHITKEDFVSQTFMIFVSIYGTQWLGQRSTVNLPLKYLNIDGRIYFDYVVSNEVRGGKKPIMLVILKKNIHPLIEKLFDTLVEPYITNLVNNWDKQNPDDISRSLFDLYTSIVTNIKIAFPLSI